MSIFRAPQRHVFPLVGKDSIDLFKELEDVFCYGHKAKDESQLGRVPMHLNIVESKEGYHIEAEVPGVKREDIDISINGDQLVVRGEKNSFNEENRANYHRIERSHGSFYRSIVLPKDVNHENINAALVDGVLKIDLMKSKSEEKGAKKISIN